MNKKIYYNELYDYYKELLTEKQREYYESYFFCDYSLQEIAENQNVSRNAIHNQIKIVLEKLDFYEEKLKNHEHATNIRKIIQNLDEKVKQEIEKNI